MVAMTVALLALALQPAIVPQHRPARLGVSPALQLGGQVATPVRRALGMKSSKRTIYIDGNNLMMQRKVTKGREKLAERLVGIRGADVVIVFDGRAGAFTPLSAWLPTSIPIGSHPRRRLSPMSPQVRPTARAGTALVW
jgi:hypothetical protein